LTRNFELKKEEVVIAGQESGRGMGNGLFVLYPRESKKTIALRMHIEGQNRCRKDRFALKSLILCIPWSM
jgi:hypothetical protein